MDVVELAPGLWRWTTAHPDWTRPSRARPEGWEREVGSVYCKAGDDVVLVDPLVPSEEAERVRFWQALDRDVAGASTVRVLLTCVWHAQGSAEIVDRHGARLWIAPLTGGGLPGGVEAVDAALEDEVLLFLSSHAALVAGDTLLGAGGVETLPGVLARWSRLGGRSVRAARASEWLADRLRAARARQTVTTEAAAALDRALAA